MPSETDNKRKAARNARDLALSAGLSPELAKKAEQAILKRDDPTVPNYGKEKK